MRLHRFITEGEFQDANAAELDLAEGHFADALKMNGQIRARLFSAETQLDWAEMLLARGTKDAAVDCREHLQQCLDVVRELGLPSLKTRALSLAERAGA